MKYDKKEPETMDADPMRLLVSAILAFTVMLFINGFVGSMGGFPAFVAFTLVFFRIRTRAGMENGGMQQELSDRQITGRLLWKYAAGYLVLWGILRIAFLISRVTGWGNINGASAVEYVRQMWNTSLLEKWAYFFAGMIMFAFVLSLFPLAVIREKVRWIRYALVDGAVFALVCLGMNGVCRLKFEQKSSGRATCLIDHLLLCGRMRTWQEITCLLKEKPANPVIVAKAGVAGLDIITGLKVSLGRLIWFSDLDFGVQAYQLGIPYFNMKPITHEKVYHALKMIEES